VRRLRSDQSGFTLIEVIVAAFCLALTMGAAAMLFGVGDSNSLATQRQSEAINLADQYLEKVRLQVKTSSGGFANLAMSAAPAAGTNSTLANESTVHTDPDDFVSAASGCGPSNEGYLIEANWDNTTEGTAPGVSSWSPCASGAEPLVINTTSGYVTPVRTVTVGSATATIYTYVTDTNIGCYSTLGTCNSYNSGTPLGDAKRVIVAVVMNNGGTENTGTAANLTEGPNTPMYASTILTNPVPSNQSNSSIGLNLGVSLG
jgi:prepilin-type N-terminal cleavage/methylation domain-containing protein